MQLKNTKKNYGIVAIILHWVMAISLIGLFVLGKIMVDLNYYDAGYISSPWWHTSLGVGVFILLLSRFIWRITNIKPNHILTHTSWEIKAANIVQLLFYGLIFIICISGYFISTNKGKSIYVFDWFEVPAILTMQSQLADFMGALHDNSAYILVILFTLHTSAALKHHFVNNDNTLTRIIKP